MKRKCMIILMIMLLAGLANITSAGQRTEDEAKLLCLNIGKADCMLLFYGETCWLIDAGYEQTYSALETALAEYQVDYLDGVFLTHCHDDHDGGLAPLAQGDIPVDAWYAASIWYDVKKGKHPAVAAAKKRSEEVTWLSAGDTIPVGNNASFKVLGPLEVDKDNENNNSLVLLLTGLTLAPGESWVIGSKNTEVSVDQTWDGKKIWSRKKRDVGILYDPRGRPVACADNGLEKD